MNVTEIHVNGAVHRLGVDSQRSLLAVLREELGLTGTKYGCGEGQCGACTVVVDGRSVRSCLTTVGSVSGKQITTIEGLEKDGRLHRLQEAFIQEGAMQCGYCTAGMIMSGAALLGKTRQPTRQEIIRFMDGNICRCGTYSRIIRAIEMAAAAAREGK